MTDFKQMVKAWDTPDKMTFFGAAALVVLTILPWHSVKHPMGNQSTMGLDVWNGWMALLFGLVVITWFLAPKLFDAVPEPVKSNVPLIASILACVLGPVILLMRGGGPSIDMSELGISSGRTIFYWLALLASLAAVAGAVLKKVGSQQPGAGGFRSGVGPEPPSSGTPAPPPPPPPSP